MQLPPTTVVELPTTTVELPTTTTVELPTTTTLPQPSTTTVANPLSTTPSLPAAPAPPASPATPKAVLPAQTSPSASGGSTPTAAAPAADGAGAPPGTSPAATDRAGGASGQADSAATARQHLLARTHASAGANGTSAFVVPLGDAAPGSQASGPRGTVPGSAPTPPFQDLADALAGVPVLGTAGAQKAKPGGLGLEIDEVPGLSAFVIAASLGVLAFFVASAALPRLAAAAHVPLSRAAEQKVRESALVVAAAVFGVILALLITYANV